ncbi:MAG: hemopexin repeat-containing protein [Oceanococcus sp.]
MFIGNNRQTKTKLFFFMAAVLLGGGSAQASIDFCWKDSFGRGAGTLPTECPSGTHKEGAFCYDDCEKKGDVEFSRGGPGECTQVCPPGKAWQDQGFFCRKNEYHVSEYPWQGGDGLSNAKMYERCRKVHGKDNCTDNGLLVFEACPDGYSHILGFCRPDEAPDCAKLGFIGQFDLSCTKRIYHRTPRAKECGNDKYGNPLIKQAGLCYASCGSSAYYGEGPVCWGQCSKNTLPFECGAGCTDTATSCGTQTTNLVVSVLDSAYSITSTIATLGAAAGLNMTAKQALKQASKEGLKGLTQIKNLSKVSKSLSKEVIQDAFVGLAKQSGPAVSQVAGYTKTAGTLASNGMSFFSNITDISNGKYDSEEERDFMIAQEVLNNISLFDPSGIMGVVAAYTKPKCSVLDSGGEDPTSSVGGAGEVGSSLERYTEFLKSRRDLLYVKYIEAGELREEYRQRRDVYYSAAKPFQTREKHLSTQIYDQKIFRNSDEFRSYSSATKDRFEQQLRGLVAERSAIWTEIKNIQDGVQLTATQKADLAAKRHDFDIAGSIQHELNGVIGRLISLVGHPRPKDSSQNGNPALVKKEYKAFVRATVPIAAAKTVASGQTYLFYENGYYDKVSSNNRLDDPRYPIPVSHAWVKPLSQLPEFSNGITAAMGNPVDDRGFMWNSKRQKKGGAERSVTYYVGLDRENLIGSEHKMGAGEGGYWNFGGQSYGKKVDAAFYDVRRGMAILIDQGYVLEVLRNGSTVDFQKTRTGGNSMNNIMRTLPVSWRVDGVDAATYRNGKIYIIKGKEYVRMTGQYESWGTFRGYKVDAGYPKSVLTHFPE